MTSLDDVRRHLPAELLEPENDFVRDALVEALAALLDEYQLWSDRAAANSDPARAIEQSLDALGWDRQQGRVDGEEAEAYRARVLQTQKCATLAAIAAGVNFILAPFTDTECQINEAALDRWFLNSGGPNVKWRSFIGAGPHYPSRLFRDDAPNNGGISRPNSAVGGARCYSDSIGRHFLLRLPDLRFRNTSATFAFNNMRTAMPEPTVDGVGAQVYRMRGGFFAGSTTSPSIAAFPNSTGGSARSIYRAVESFVNTVAGQSMRWSMQADLPA